jgi:hypothetical protein
MIRRTAAALLCACAFAAASDRPAAAEERAYGQVWGSSYSMRDWERF